MMNIASVLMYIMIALSVLFVPIGLILGIVFAVLAQQAENQKEKRRNIIISVALLIAAPLVLAIVLSIWGLVNVIYSASL